MRVITSVTEHFQGGRFPDPSFSWPGLGSLWGLESSRPPQNPNVHPAQSRSFPSPLAPSPHSSACPRGASHQGPTAQLGGSSPITLHIAKVSIPPVTGRATWGETHWLQKPKDNAIRALPTGKPLDHHSHVQNRGAPASPCSLRSKRHRSCQSPAVPGAQQPRQRRCRGHSLQHGQI